MLRVASGFELKTSAAAKKPWLWKLQVPSYIKETGIYKSAQPVWNKAMEKASAKFTKAKRALFNHPHRSLVVGATLLGILLVVLFFSWALSNHKPPVRLSQEDIQSLLAEMNIEQSQADISTTSQPADQTESKYDVIDVTVIRSLAAWPITDKWINLTEDEITTDKLNAPLRGPVTFLIQKNLEYIHDKDRHCAAPSSYTVPINLITLRDQGTLYNVHIDEFYGERSLVYEKSLRGDEKRSALYSEGIVVSHMHGKKNVTDPNTAFCIQSYYLADR